MSRSVHPRSRGEHLSRSGGWALGCGSSPLARGTLVTRGRLLDVDRFIPARAGNTPCAGSRRAPATVHPRSRGEHEEAEDRPDRAAGSSPLARGTRWAPTRRRRSTRFIPARAGNTLSVGPPLGPAPVHPRSRGEHYPVGGPWLHLGGSSPLARGTRDRAGASGARARFIPARAGNTSGAATTRSAAPVHPRSRGEHPVARIAALDTGGSSPLARGTPLSRVLTFLRLRFIPARAGNTGGFGAPAPCHTVHPRSRGEHP